MTDDKKNKPVTARRRGILNHEGKDEVCPLGDSCPLEDEPNKPLIEKRYLNQNSSDPITLEGSWCDVCLKCPIEGKEYKCKERDCNTTLCSECIQYKSHCSNHSLTIVENGKEVGQTERCNECKKQTDMTDTEMGVTWMKCSEVICSLCKECSGNGWHKHCRNETCNDHLDHEGFTSSVCFEELKIRVSAYTGPLQFVNYFKNKIIIMEQLNI